MEIIDIEVVTADYGGGVTVKTKGIFGKPFTGTFSGKNTLASGKFPLIIFFHGTGGGSSPAALRNEALPRVYQDVGVWGFRPDDETKRVDYVLISLCDYWWSMPPQYTETVIKWVEQKYPGLIDHNHIIATGLSAGGANVMSAIYDAKVAQFYSAAIPLSVQGLPSHDASAYTAIKQYRIETMFGVGNTDGGYKENTIEGNKLANTAFPGSSNLIIYDYPNGHGGWDIIYDPRNTFPELKNKNVWTWAIADAIPVTPEPIPPVVPAKKLKMKIFDDWSSELVA